MADSERPRGIILDTLGSMAELGEGLTAYCYEADCRASLTLDMATLIWTRGLAFPSNRIASRLRCPKCGSRKVGVRVQAWTKPMPSEPVPLTDAEQAERERREKRQRVTLQHRLERG